MEFVPRQKAHLKFEDSVHAQSLGLHTTIDFAANRPRARRQAAEILKDFREDPRGPQPARFESEQRKTERELQESRMFFEQKAGFGLREPMGKHHLVETRAGGLGIFRSYSVKGLSGPPQPGGRGFPRRRPLAGRTAGVSSTGSLMPPEREHPIKDGGHSACPADLLSSLRGPALTHAARERGHGSRDFSAGRTEGHFQVSRAAVRPHHRHI